MTVELEFKLVDFFFCFGWFSPSFSRVLGWVTQSNLLLGGPCEGKTLRTPGEASFETKFTHFFICPSFLALNFVCTWTEMKLGASLVFCPSFSSPRCMVTSWELIESWTLSLPDRDSADSLQFYGHSANYFADRRNKFYCFCGGRFCISLIVEFRLPLD